MKKLLTLFLCTGSVLFWSCDKSDDFVGSPGDDPGTEENAVRLATNETFGSYLTDTEGNTLYFFSRDSKGSSECSGGCLDNWPVFYSEDLSLDEGLEPGDFGTITREGGQMQTTYKGWPLYYFINDTESGQINGDGAGNVWYVAKPDYSLMIVQAQLVGRNTDGEETELTGSYEPGEENTFYITDDRGNTLYRFIPDFRDINTFTAEDFSNDAVWPIFHVEIDKLPSLLNAEDFGSIDVFGRSQLTFKGWPVYKFGQDAQRGDNFGVGFPRPGVWPIINPDTPEAPEKPENTVQLGTDETFGSYLTDIEGNTLYFFSRDSKGSSECSGGCLDNWPLFYTEDLVLSEGLEPDDFGTITREGGQMQTTYKGWPLYYFINDTESGQINGDGTGNVWYVAKPDYSLMIVQAQLVGRNTDGEETELTGSYEPGEENTFYITDDRGNTLYRFIPDFRDINTFTAEDFSNDAVWPIFHVEIDKLPSLLNAEDFGSIDVFGRSQLTFKGWPVYKFGQDAQRGDNFGVGFPRPGVWPIINPDTPEAPEKPENTVQLGTDETFGSYLTDIEGNTLYFFSRDSKGSSECSGGCLDNWPLFYTEDLVLSEGLEPDDFGTITREGGQMQTTYKGWPLYYFI
ncbi:MAG: hypothetical protein AAFX53_00005, partial [Bacteroidota bacterium]